MIKIFTKIDQIYKAINSGNYDFQYFLRCKLVINLLLKSIIHLKKMKIKRENIIAMVNKQTTLGGRSEFEYAIENGKLLLRFGKMIDFFEVKKDYIVKVKNRIDHLKDKNPKYKTQTSLYNKKLWKECPNNRTCPYVACLIINQKI